MPNVKQWDPTQQERFHFVKVVSAFQMYRTYSHQRVEKTENYLSSLPENHQLYLNSYKNHLRDIKNCIDHNNEVFECIIQDVSTIFQNVKDSLDLMIPPGIPQDAGPVPDCMDMDKVMTVLRQIARDWSEECAAERKASYDPIVREVVAEFPPDICAAEEVRVLVPGAGLGRLAFEIARRGFACQGNDHSLYMLLASNFILNRCKGANKYTVHPWIHQNVNNMSSEDQTRSIAFPDINPSELLKGVNFSMAAGDFLEVYVQNEEWNCVATCFFIDCASNVVSYIETIFNILKPGGIWINLGPLLYYFSDFHNEESIEPSYEDLREIIISMGFIFEKEETDVRTTYTQNPRSMAKYEYNSIFFVCRKPKMFKRKV